VELTPAQVVTGMLREYESFACLIGSLSPAQWQTPTRCRGWAVRDVAAHVAGNAADSARAAAGTRTPDEQARDLRQQLPAELAARLSAAAAELCSLLQGLGSRVWERPSSVPGRTIGNGLLTLWYDAYVHDDDIRSVLGQPSQRGPGLEASVLWLRTELERKGWSGARLLLDGMGDITVGAGGPDVRGDPLRFVLVATGRADPAELGLDEHVNVYRRSVP
jgi:uncharacterized protein (TIGR03083 family)